MGKCEVGCMLLVLLAVTTASGAREFRFVQTGNNVGFFTTRQVARSAVW